MKKKELKIFFITLVITIALVLVFFMYEDFKKAYKNETKLILIEQIEAIGFGNSKLVIIKEEEKKEKYLAILDILDRQEFNKEISITIDGQDYKTVMDTIQNKIYNEQVCEEYDTDVIRVNGGPTYYISQDDNAIIKEGKQAEISDEDLQKIKNIIKAVTDNV